MYVCVYIYYSSSRKDRFFRWSGREAVENVRETAVRGGRTTRGQTAMAKGLQGRPTRGRQRTGY